MRRSRTRVRPSRPPREVPSRQAWPRRPFNGAEQIALRARDCGMEVVYEDIRLTPADIVNAVRSLPNSGTPEPEEFVSIEAVGCVAARGAHAMRHVEPTATPQPGL